MYLMLASNFISLLLQFLKGWGYSHVPPCPASRALLETWIPGPTKAANGIFIIGQEIGFGNFQGSSRSHRAVLPSECTTWALREGRGKKRKRQVQSLCQGKL